jgi:hypothetical protein
LVRTPTIRTSRPLTIILLLLAFFLRTYQLDGQSLRGDEAATVLYSALPITELWELARVTDPHPPLYYLMLHPWQGLVGEGAWAMRFAGVGASVLAVAALSALARRSLHDTGVSLFAAALLAVNPLQIWLAQDIRSYPFFSLLGLLSSAALWQALRVGEPTGQQHATERSLPGGRNTQHVSRPLYWILYVVLTVACFYIHYYTAFLIAFQGLFVLLNFREFWDQKWPWLASQIVMGLLLIPGLQLAYRFAGGEAAGGIDTLPTFDMLRLTITSLLTGFTIDDTWGGWVGLLLIPLWAIGLVTLLRRDRVSGSFWGLYFAVPVLGVIALSIGRPFFKERFLIQAQPAFELLLAVGFLTLWRMSQRPQTHSRAEGPLAAGSGQAAEQSTTSTHSAPLHASRFTPHASRLLASLLLALLLFANIIALTNYFAVSAYAKAPPWRLYHDYVSGQARPGDVMLTNFPEASVSYYSPNDLPFYVVPAERDRPVEFRLEQTEQIANAYQRIWFLPLLRQGFDEQGDVLNWLDRHADRVNQVFFPDYHLNLYLSPAVIETRLISQPTTFSNGVHLRGYQILDKKGDSRLSPIPAANGQEYLLTLEPEETFTLSLYWQADGPTDVPYTVFVHLMAADGFNRTSQDNQPVWGSYPTTLWQPGEKISDKYTLTIPPGAPPGDHRLSVGWYDSATQQRVPIINAASQPTADHVILNTLIRVE